MRWILLCVLLLPCLVSCQQHEPVFKIGITRWLGYEPLYLAEQLSFYPQIDVVRLSSTLDVLRALRNGNLQGAGLTLDETLTLIGEGIDLQIVMIIDYSNGADLVMASPAVASLQDLKGKRIGVEMNAVGATLLRSMLSKAGLTLNDVVVESMPISHLAQACATQRIEVAVAYQPYARELENCSMKPIFTSAEIPGKIVDLLVVRRDALHQQDQMHQLLRGYFQALQHITEHPVSSHQQMADNLGISVADVQRDLEGIHVLSLAEVRTQLSAQGNLRSVAEEYSNTLHEQGVIRTPIDILPHLDARWLPGAAP